MSVTMTYELRVDGDRLVRSASIQHHHADWPTQDERRRARVLGESILRAQVREAGEVAQFRYPPVRPLAKEPAP